MNLSKITHFSFEKRSKKLIKIQFPQFDVTVFQCPQTPKKEKSAWNEEGGLEKRGEMEGKCFGRKLAILTAKIQGKGEILIVRIKICKF